MKRVCSSLLIFFISLIAILPSRLDACDLCSIYRAFEIENPQPGVIHFGIAESFTEYGKLQDGGDHISNDFHQRLNSSITQFVTTYDITEEFGVQATLPYISRRFRRLEDDSIQRGTEAGIGDLSILIKYSPFRYTNGELVIATSLVAGIKLPTGNTDRLAEELLEHDNESELKHLEEDKSAVHGHDLALGSGSIDFPLGASVLAQYDRFGVYADLQYSIRTEGDHSYRYANDFQWSVAPGYLALLQHNCTIAARARLSGEYKGEDRGHDNQKQDDTSINSLFIGPQIVVTVGDRLLGDVGIDLPINIENSGLQSVASYRLRAALTYQW